MPVPRDTRALGILYFVAGAMRDLRRILGIREKVGAETVDRALDELTARGVEEILADEDLQQEEIERVLMALGKPKAEAENVAELIIELIELERKQRAVRVDRKDGRQTVRSRAVDSLMRLLDLMDAEAPKAHIAYERSVAKEWIAKLDPTEANALLRKWPRAARALERDEEPKHPKQDREKPN